MEAVEGIGGVFFVARDAGALGQWYEDHLGIIGPGESYGDAVWEQAAGPTVFAPFGQEHAESPHLGPSGWGINFRVRDLDVMVEQLSDHGIEVEVDPELYPNGRFASLHDPEGNSIQLWQPMDPET